MGGWFYGRLEGNSHKNVELRRAQFRTADMDAVCVALARRLVGAKLSNCRVLLRRNYGDVPSAVLQGIDEAKQRLDELEKARNFIAHNRLLLSSEFQRIEMYVSDWNRVVGL